VDGTSLLLLLSSTAFKDDFRLFFFFSGDDDNDDGFIELVFDVKGPNKGVIVVVIVWGGRGTDECVVHKTGKNLGHVTTRFLFRSEGFPPQNRT